MTSERFEGSNLGFSELVPRYVLIEDTVRGQRVLEVGTVDPEWLLRLAAAGASRLAATAERPDRFDRSGLRGRRIELLAMEPGQLDFDDHSFDVVLVPDLIASLASNPEFLGDLRRVLSPGGYALLGFEAAGRRLGELFGGRGTTALRADPRRVVDAIKKTFGRLKLYRQTAFIGVAFLADASSAEAGLSLDTSLSGTEGEPSHLMAIVGRLEALPDERTLVELPMSALESLAFAAERERLGERARLERALETARDEIEKREASLRAIGEKLPALKAAVDAQNQRADEDAARNAELAELRESVRLVESARAQLDARRQAAEDELVAERALRMELEAQQQQLISREASLEARANELERAAQQLALDAQARIEELDHRLTASRLKEIALAEELERSRHWIVSLERERSELTAQVGRLESAAADQELGSRVQIARAQEAAEESAREVEEIRRRTRELERSHEHDRQRIEALEAEIESHARMRHHLGSDVREAESRAAMLARRLEEQALERAEEVHQLMGRAAALAEALSAETASREAAQARAERLEEAFVEGERKTAELERRLEAASRRVIEERHQHDAHDEVRREAFSARTQAESLMRQLADRDAALASLREEMRAAAVAAASQVEGLRGRVQELRNERDTLARASQMLIEERDLAAALGRQVVEAEQRAKALAIQLASRDDALARAEAERDAAEHARGAFEGALRDLAEANKRTEGEAAAALLRATQAERDAASHRSRVQALDQQLARVHAEAQGRAVLAADAERRLPELEELLREAAQSLREAQRENQAWRDRASGLDRARTEAELQANDVLQARLRAEAELADMAEKKIVLTGELGRAKADLAMAGARLQAAEAAWRRVMAERDALGVQLREVEATAQVMLLDLERARSRPSVDLEVVEDARRAVAAAEAVALRERREREQAALGLGKTLEHAAEMSKRLTQLERDVAAARAERDRAVAAMSAMEAAASEAVRAAQTRAEAVASEAAALRAAEEARSAELEALRAAAEEHRARREDGSADGRSTELLALREALRATEWERDQREADARHVAESMRSGYVGELSALREALREAELDRARGGFVPPSELLALRVALREAEEGMARERARSEALVIERLHVLSGAEPRSRADGRAARGDDRRRAGLGERAAGLMGALAELGDGAVSIRDVDAGAWSALAGEDDARALAALRADAQERWATAREVEPVEPLPPLDGPPVDGAPAGVHQPWNDEGPRAVPAPVDREQIALLEAELQAARDRAAAWAIERAELLDRAERAEARSPDRGAVVERVSRDEEDAIASAIHAPNVRIPVEEPAFVFGREVDVAARIALEEALDHERWRRTEAESRLGAAQRELEQVVARSASALESAKARILESEHAITLARAERDAARAELDRRQAEWAAQAAEADRAIGEERARTLAAEAARSQAELMAERAVAESASIDRLRTAEIEASRQAEARVVALEAMRGRALEAEARVAWAAGVQAELEQRLAASESRLAEVMQARAEEDIRRAAEADELAMEAEARWTDVRAMLEARLVEVEAAWREAEQRAAELDRHVARLHEELATARQDADRVREEAQAEHALAAELMARLAAAQPASEGSDDGVLEGARLQIEVLENDLEAIEAERQADAAHVVAVERASAEARAQADRLAAELAQAQASNRQADEARQRAEDELARVLSELAQSDHVRAQLEARVEDAESRATQHLMRAEAARMAQVAADEKRAALERAMAERPGSTDGSANDRLMRAKLADAEGRLARAEAHSARLDGALAKAELRASDAEARAAKAEEQLLRIERSAGRIEARAVEAEKRATEAETRAHQATTRLGSVEPRARGLEQRALDAEARAVAAERAAQKAESAWREAEQRAAQMAEELARARGGAVAPGSAPGSGSGSSLPPAARASDAPRGASSSAAIQLQAAREEIEILRDNLRAALARPPEGDARPAGPGLTASLRARCESLESAVAHRDAEIQRLRAQQERAAAEVDEARAEVGRRLNELRAANQGSDELKREVAELRRAVEQLRASGAGQGETAAAQLGREVQARQQEIERLQAQRVAIDGELRRLKGQLTGAEQSGAKLGLRVAELEAAVADGQERIELLRRELADKSERLRRMTGRES